jgi:two-component system nitrogen regulation sensor histidine kinase GlnL
MYSYKFVVDKELRIRYWDKNLERVTGKFSVEMMDVPYFQVQPRILNKNADAIKQVLREGKSIQFKEYKVNCFSGTSKADIIINPIKDENSETIAAEVIIEDLNGCTVSKELTQSRTLIDIGKASTILAHGVRSPLNAIKGAIVYLQDKYCDDSIFVEFSSIIINEISKLDSFITKFLSNSIFESEIDNVDMQLLLDRVITMISLQAKTKNICFIKQYEQIQVVKTDTFKIEQVILNIINNAIDAVPYGGYITLKTSMTNYDSKDYIIVEISDSGAGIKNCTSDESLYTLKKESNVKGRGYGLFITHEIVKNLGGYLEIKSEKMAGTTVKINIPVHLH